MLISLVFVVLLSSANLVKTSENEYLSNLKFENKEEDCHSFNTWLLNNKDKLLAYEKKANLSLTAAKFCQRNDLRNLDPRTFIKTVGIYHLSLGADKYLQFLLKTSTDPGVEAVFNPEYNLCLLHASDLTCMSLIAALDKSYEHAIVQYKEQCDYLMDEILGVLRIFGRENLPPILEYFTTLPAKEGYLHDDKMVNHLTAELLKVIQDYFALYPIGEKHTDSFNKLMKETREVVTILLGKIELEPSLEAFGSTVLITFLQNTEKISVEK